jgi:soluble lytic murein transglycosylase-like protein
MINQALAAHPKWAYLDPAWIMTIMSLESGYRPLVWNGAGRQDGLMQVIPSTAAAMAALYGIPAGPQTDPMVSVNSGTAYLDASARDIIKKRNAVSLPLWDLDQAYNEGMAAIEAGKLDPAYNAKFQAQLPVIEAQMAATAALVPSRANWAPQRRRSVMPLLTESGR